MPNYKVPTRLNDTNRFLYGRSPGPLPDNGLLPTRSEVDLAIEFKLETLAATQKISNSGIKTAVTEVVREVETIWGRLVPSIKLQDFPNIVRKVERMRKDRQAEAAFVGKYGVQPGVQPGGQPGAVPGVKK